MKYFDGEEWKKKNKNKFIYVCVFSLSLYSFGTLSPYRDWVQVSKWHSIKFEVSRILFTMNEM